MQYAIGFVAGVVFLVLGQLVVGIIAWLAAGRWMVAKSAVAGDPAGDDLMAIAEAVTS